MPCPACGDAATPPGARFCESCGAPLDPTAARAGCRCAAPKPDAQGYCESCGLKTKDARVEYEQAADATLALASDRGKKHPTNQDFAAIARRADGAALLVVADGVSTSDEPERAARAAVEAALRAFNDNEAPPASLSEEAAELARVAAEAVSAIPVAVRLFDGPASTLVVALARERAAGGAREIGLAWVGDSRAYLVAPNVPAAVLTRDDSWLVEQVEAGAMTQAEALRAPLASAITQWLGMPADTMRIHAGDAVLTPGAALLLCSDGLWKYADDADAFARAYTEAARGAPDALGVCRKLVAFALAAGGADNISVALLRV